MSKSNKMLCMLFCFVLIFTLYTISHKIIVVTGDSMFPTLINGQLVSASYVVLPEFGHIYLVKEPDDDVLAIKRLIGLPGDHIKLKEGVTYRNGKEVMGAPGDSWDNMEWVLQVDEYLFFGDNRAVSYDSRFWSRPVKFEEIKFKLDFVIYPFVSWGAVNVLDS